MQRIIRLWSTLAIAALLAVLGVATSASGALAYGRADHPLAQIELSANCNNPAFPLCYEPPAGVGLGGLWLWIEIDAGGTGDVAGAGCGHVRGLGGGAESVRGEISWVTVTIPPGVIPYWTDPTNTYYLVWLPGGQSIPFPVTVGHYSFMPEPAVAIQLQVAP